MAEGITVEHRPASDHQPALEIRRSRRRRKTASAHGRDGVVVLQIPAGMPAHEERRIIDRLVRRVTGVERAAAAGGDLELEQRALRLADRYLDGVRPTSVRWSERMQRRWGSCSPTERTIRISTRSARFPAYVLDAILVHELAHLQVSAHTPAFWELVARYPEADRARGFLEGFEHAAADPSDR